nr:transcription initiation factor IIB [Candidatus Sigynarchaeum springense]MDO8119043.1 transcription initiation factor IIB [Candidatus Sigynarchaeota archaeon]
MDTTGSEKEVIKCTECGSDKVIVDPSRGERICGECGLVLEEKSVDAGPEWRAFSSQEEKARARTGSPSTLTVHDKGLSTVIDWRDKDAHGNRLDPNMRAKVYRIRKWQVRTRVHSTIDRNLAQAMAELDRLSSQLSIPRGVKEASAMMYRKAIERKLSRGRSIEAMVGACIYAACRSRKIPRTLDEIAQFSRVSPKDLGRCYRIILRELGIKIPLASPVDFITRFGAELHVSGVVQRRAIDVLEKARVAGITVGKDPTGLAAAALYIATMEEQERRTQREIAEVAHVTEVTVRNRYKELAAFLCKKRETDNKELCQRAA